MITKSTIDSLLLFARQWTGDAEDVVQSALLKLLSASEQEKEPENVTAWLFSVVRNESMDRLRRRKTRQNWFRRYSVETPTWFEPEHESRLDAEAVTQNLQKLPLELREIIVAKIWGDLSYEQIAEMLGTSKSTVHRKYVEGLEKLKKMFNRAS